MLPSTSFHSSINRCPTKELTFELIQFPSSLFQFQQHSSSFTRIPPASPEYIQLLQYDVTGPDDGGGLRGFIRRAGPWTWPWRLHQAKFDDPSLSVSTGIYLIIPTSEYSIHENEQSWDENWDEYAATMINCEINKMRVGEMRWECSTMINCEICELRGWEVRWECSTLIDMGHELWNWKFKWDCMGWCDHNFE